MTEHPYRPLFKLVIDLPSRTFRKSITTGQVCSRQAQLRYKNLVLRGNNKPSHGTDLASYNVALSAHPEKRITMQHYPVCPEQPASPLIPNA